MIDQANKLKVLLLYSTVDGYTKVISEYIAQKLAPFQADIASIDKVERFKLTDYGLVVIGASIRYGKHRPELYRFIDQHQAALNAMPNAFFSVNAVARKPDKNTDKTNPYVKKFIEQSAWRPNKIAVFAGKLDYPSYTLLNKLMLGFIMWITKGPTDLTKTYELTDWSRVDAFAAELKK